MPTRSRTRLFIAQMITFVLINAGALVARGLVVGGLVVGGPVWAKTEASETATNPELCDIPFTASHRAALLGRHIPNLQRIHERWRSEEGQIQSYESRTIREIEEILKRLYESASDAPVDPRTDVVGLSDEPRFEFPRRPSIWLEDLRLFELSFSLDERRAIDAAMRALTHWSCATTRIDVVKDAMTVIYELIGLQYRQPLPYAGWRQLTRVMLRQIDLHPVPMTEQIYLTRWIEDLLRRGTDPAWTADPEKVAMRAALHLAVTDWVLGRAGSRGSDIGSVHIRFDRGYSLSETQPPAWTDAATNATVFQKAMAFHDRVMADGHRLIDDNPDALFFQHYHMMRLSLEAGYLDQASCFFRKLEQVVQDEAMPPGYIGDFEGLEASLSAAYGTDWVVKYASATTTCD